MKRKPAIRESLERLYDLCKERFDDPPEAWDRMIEYLAADSCNPLMRLIPGRLDWYSQDHETRRKINGVFSPQLLRYDFHDHLGDMYAKHVNHEARFRIPNMGEAEQQIAQAVPKTSQIIQMTDPSAGIGRRIMCGYRRAPNGLFFGVDTDLRALRVAFANCAFHGIRSYLLHADQNIHDIDPETKTGWFNWNYSNQWDSHMDDLQINPRILPCDA